MKNNINIVASEIFNVFLITYLVFILAETLDEGFVTNFLNLNWLLIIVVISGLTSTILGTKTTILKSHKEDWFWPGLLAFMGGLLIFYKLQGEPNISVLLAIISGVITSVMTFLILS